MFPNPKLSRRDFARIVGVSACVPGLIPREPTAVSRFARSLTAAQRRILAFPFDHPLRSVAINNWKIVEPRIENLARSQQDLCREVFETLCSPEGVSRFDRSMRDDYGGFAKSHVAVFGDPESGPLEWVLTGRHVTIRADGRTGASAAGPIFLGHGETVHDFNGPSDEGNVWREFGRLAASFLASVDRKLIPWMLRGNGLVGAALDAEGKRSFQNFLRAVTLPFRGGGLPAIEACLFPLDGADKLRIRFFGEDTRSGRVWRVIGPDFRWYYCELPHAHSWIEFGPE